MDPLPGLQLLPAGQEERGSRGHGWRSQSEVALLGNEVLGLAVLGHFFSRGFGQEHQFGCFGR